MTVEHMLVQPKKRGPGRPRKHPLSGCVPSPVVQSEVIEPGKRYRRGRQRWYDAIPALHAAGPSNEWVNGAGPSPDWGNTVGHAASTPLYWDEATGNLADLTHQAAAASPSLFDFVHTASPPYYGGDTAGPSTYADHSTGPSPYGVHAAGTSPNGGYVAGPPLWLTAWKPCERCKGEFEKLLREKRRVDLLISRIDPGQLREFRNLIDFIGEIHREQYTNYEQDTNHEQDTTYNLDTTIPSAPPGQQELFPDSGLFVSSFRLAAMQHASKQDSMRLFHLLFDCFFTEAECENAVAFGRHGRIPEGKRILERKKVNGILTYVLRCASLPGWTAINESKLKKAVINKCRARAGAKQ